MVKLIGKNMKTVIMAVFHVFKDPEKRLNILSTHMDINM